MTDRIDLGDALASFDDGVPPRPTRPAQPTVTEHPDGSATIPLADLQAAGFNIVPPPGLQFPRQPTTTTHRPGAGRITWSPAVGIAFTPFPAGQMADMEAIRGIGSAFDRARFFGEEADEDEEPDQDG